MILIKAVMTKKEMIIGAAMLADKERESLLNTHRLHGVDSQDTILFANEQRDFSSFFVLFFCSFTDKILNS